MVRTDPRTRQTAGRGGNRREPGADRSVQGQGTPLSAALKRIFGFTSFRANQEEIVRSVLNGHDAFVVMPTGGGKSLCYQLPAHLIPGTCIVVSPLISLMKDQVDAANGVGLRAAYYNSSLTGDQRLYVFKGLRTGKFDLLYVSPERIAMEGFLNTLKAMRICLFAIDEAHCISEWGHDFRPDYLYLARLVDMFPEVPVAAFTAAATERVQTDIMHRLGLRNPHVVRASFNRSNLFYQVMPKEDVLAQILQFVRARPEEPGIVYRTTRDDVERTAAALVRNGIRAMPYHAGLDDSIRRHNQEAFKHDEIQVVVATIAFGMGIDKSNVRFVLHGDLPKNLESYYQETGRAGRDGEPAHCLLLFGAGDIPKIRFFINQIADDQKRQTGSQQLNDMVKYATANTCRRCQLLSYFGEVYGHDHCGACDVCTREVERWDATTEAQMVMSAVARTRERFGTNQIIDIVVGSNTKQIRQRGLDRLKTYGAGKDKPKRYWRRMVDELVAQECIVRTDDTYPVLRLTEKGRRVLAGQKRFLAVTPVERQSPGPVAARRVGYNKGLFEELRQLRYGLAATRNVPPFIVFSDRTLHEMARMLPTTLEEMRNVSGVGEVKLREYGEQFLKAISRFVDTHPETLSVLNPGKSP